MDPLTSGERPRYPQLGHFVEAMHSSWGHGCSLSPLTMPDQLCEDQSCVARQWYMPVICKPDNLSGFSHKIPSQLPRIPLPKETYIWKLTVAAQKDMRINHRGACSHCSTAVGGHTICSTWDSAGGWELLFAFRKSAFKTISAPEWMSFSSAGFKSSKAGRCVKMINSGTIGKTVSA